MATAKTGLGLLVATSVCLWASLGCQPGGQGDPCIPEDEYTTSFSGYDEDEVNVESRSFQCETRVCLVNHFRGRVSCPYGQDETDISSYGGEDDRRCHIPGTTGAKPTDAVDVPVKPQLYKRRAERSVYCSCRCKNAQGKTDDGSVYCDCASGFTCTQLIDDLGLGSARLSGAYCIRNGTEFNDKAPPGDPCEKEGVERREPDGCSPLGDDCKLACGDRQPY